MNGTKEGEFRV